jgi:WD40 repeat protein
LGGTKRQSALENDIGFLQEALELYSIRQAVWTPDQTLVATGSDNGKIQLWDVATGTLRWSIKCIEFQACAPVISSL